LYYTDNKETEIQQSLPKTIANACYIITSALFHMPLVTKHILAPHRLN